MHTLTRSTFTTVKTEGAILPADLLQRVADGRSLDGLTPADYHLAPSERLNEAINRSWNRCLGVWQSFDEQRNRLPAGDTGVTLTRERWLLILFQELGYGRLPYQGSLPLGPAADAPRYPISHSWGHAPIHLVSFRQKLDLRDPASKRSPHSLVQEYLNRAEGSLWGLLSNGLRLRVLRDNASLTRAAYVEFDLEAMMDGELYADFALLWLVCHQSRVEGEPPTACWLEKWSQAAAVGGARALDALRDGVQEAIVALGRGFLSHRANAGLKAGLQSGELSAQDYYRQLLRLVYRLIFLCVAEDRDLLLLPDTPAEAQRRYAEFYSVRRLRDLAEVQRGSPHPDLYRSLRRVFVLLREGYEPLGLPGLGSFLFSERSTPALDGADLANRDLLDAVRALAFTIEGGVRRPVDYRNLGAEELGSVYESLLELHPQINTGAGTFALDVAAGSERKTTGSYYTPSSLIRSLLDSALEPVVEDRLALAGRDPTAQEAALLDIQVVDPACGSGHFLIAAAHRLARHLARARTGDEEPAPAELRAALRDVVRRCIHGVDINPMAVELCKVALWMETLDPGKPLSFLEKNIQCGNSLIGATPALLGKGIPDEAFTPIEGDDKAYCSEWRKRNKQQRESRQMSLFAPDLQPWDRLGDLAAGMMRLDAVGDDTLDAVQRQQEMYESLVRSSDYRYGRLWADAWCAAFVWKKTKEFAYPITEEVFRNVERNPFNVAPWMVEEIERLREQYQFCHWHLAFPHVFRQPATDEAPEDEQAGWSGGFDVVLGNPPWEKVQLEEKQFFEVWRPDIASATSANRRRLLQTLPDEDPVLWGKWVQALRESEATTHLIKRSGRSPLSSRGNINSYTLFLELSTDARSPRGRTGMIVPSGIATDETTKLFFQQLMESRSLVSLYDFENRAGLFPAVDSRMKFCLLTLTGPSRPAAEGAQFVFFAHRVEDLREMDRRFSLTAVDLALLNPETRTCLTFRSQREACVTKQIYSALPTLAADEGAASGWNCQSKQMLNITHDSDGFRDAAALGRMRGRFLPTGDFIDCEGHKWLRLYEGKMAGLYDHRQASVAYRSDVSYRTTRLDETSLQQHCDPSFSVRPQFWVAEARVRQLVPVWYAHHWFVAFKRITSSTNERTMIGCVVPWAGLIDAIPVVYVHDTPPNAVCLLANLNAAAFDFTARTKVGGLQLSHFILRQLPVVPASAYSQEWKPAGRDLASFVVSRALELTYTAWDLQPFAQDCGYDSPPFRWDEARRFLLRCELDAAYFHLYEIARDDVDYIMDTFPIVKRKDEAAHGEYRTKQVILEIYDEMQRAMETGQPYRTRLDPPAADPRVAHKENH